LDARRSSTSPTSSNITFHPNWRRSAWRRRRKAPRLAGRLSPEPRTGAAEMSSMWTARRRQATEFTQVLFAMLFMELRGDLELGRHLVAKAGRGGGKLNAARPALSSALTSWSFVSFVVKSLSQRMTTSYYNQHVFRHSDAASNRDFERRIRGPSWRRSLNLHVLRVPLPVTANYLPVTVLLRVHRAPPIFAQPIVIEMDFPAKTGPETAISPCFRLLPGSIRENQGAKPLSNPGLILPSSLPRKLGWSPAT